MAETSYPKLPTSSTSFIFTPENPTISPLSVFEPDHSSSDSEPDYSFEIDAKIEAFRCDDDVNDGDDDDQVRYVTNLFHRCSETDPDEEIDLELGLGLGLGLEQPAEQTVRFEGLRVVSVDSESDTEDGFLRDFHEMDDDDDGFGGVTDFDRPPFCWDYLGFNDRRNRNENDNVQAHVREVELSTIVDDDGDDDGGDYFLGRCHDGFDDEYLETLVQVDNDDDGDREEREVSGLFDAYLERDEQEVMIHSDTDEGGEFGVEEAIRDLEWEILLAVNNFNREVEDMDFNVDVYDAIFAEVEDRMNDWRGSPPAAESVIESLPSVCLEKSDDVCAICKDDISGEGIVRRLPCSHYYHGDCIVPWLRMRNTCPVCRHELPTDDADYEFRKREREGLNDEDDLTLNMQVGYDFHVFL